MNDKRYEYRMIENINHYDFENSSNDLYGPLGQALEEGYEIIQVLEVSPDSSKLSNCIQYSVLMRRTPAAKTLYGR